MSFQTIGGETADIKETTSSMYIHSDEPCFWHVIKAHFSSPTNVTIKQKHTQKFSNDNEHISVVFNSCLNYNPKTKLCGSGIAFSWEKSDLNKYLQVDVGLFNFTYEDQSSYSSQYPIKTNSTSFYTDESGTMYYIFMGYAVEGDYTYWFNTSKPAEILATAEGYDTFFYHREDFHGKINFGNEKTTCILDGTLKMNIGNNLFCWFYQPTSYVPDEIYNGFGKTSLSLGEWEFVKITQTLFPSLTAELVTPGYPFNDFFYNLPGGDYIFKTSCLFKSNYNYPDVQLFGADIKLP